MTAQVEHHKKHRLITAMVILFLLFSVTIIIKNFAVPNRTNKITTEFSLKIKEEQYAEAKEILASLDSELQHDEKEQLNINFKKILDDKINEVYRLYTENTLDSTTLLTHYENLKDFGYPLNDCDKYEGILKSSTLKQSAYYDEAIQNLEALLQTYPQDKLLIEKLQECQKEKETNFAPYSGPIQHVFFHPLIAYPELAFDNDYISKGYDDYFTTVKEFNRILDSLYQRDFILIDINSIYEKVTIDGKQIIKQKELLLPKGKKPIIISIDDMNYYEYMIQNGNVYKLMLDENGEVATYSRTPDGKENIAYDNEIVPILDEFVKKHPDFSFRGAKGIIALTGYQGILGYRTNEIDSPNFEKEKQEVLRLIKRLKETGWTFASHSYGHPDIAKVSYNRVVSDTTKWKAEVESLIGPTKVFISPYGSGVLPPDPKFQYLLDAGFEVLCNVGGAAYTKFTPNCILMDRRHLDGIAFKTQGHRLQDLFDSKEIIDAVRPQ